METATTLGSTPNQEHGPTGQTGAPGWDPLGSARALERPTRGRMLGGVAKGLADYLSVDATIVRIAFVVLTLVGGLGVPLYIAGWLLMPDASSGWSVADDFLHHAAQC